MACGPTTASSTLHCTRIDFASGTRPAFDDAMQIIGHARVSARNSTPRPRVACPRHPAGTASAGVEIAILDPYAAPERAHDIGLADYARGGGVIAVILASSAACWFAIARSVGAWLLHIG